MQQDARHRYLSSRLVDAFGILEPKFTVTVAETFFGEPNNLAVVNRFFKGDGPAHLYFTYTKTQDAEGITFVYLLFSLNSKGKKNEAN